MLEQLKQRLLEPPRCAPDCGAINRLALEATRRELQLVLEASAAARTAIPLPGNLKDWVPAEVRVDGKAVPPLVHTDDGTLWLALPAGAFRVEMTGPLPARETIQIALPLKPRFVSAHVRGWTLDGLHEDGAADESLKLSRAGGGAEREEAPPDEPGASVSLAPFLRVTRTLHLGLKWEVETVVARETPTGAPVVIDVPLLPGEAVTTAGVRVDKAKAAVNVSLGPDATEMNWRSTLTESPALRLRADPAFARSWSETWLLDLGATWHATFAGIPPIQRADADGARIAEWRPWPGEEVRIELSRPAGAGGQTLTIDTAELAVSPGTRMTRVVAVAGAPIEPRDPARDRAGGGRGAREGDARRAPVAAAPRKRRAPPGVADRAPQAGVRDQLARADAADADFSRARGRRRRPRDQRHHADPSRRRRRAGCCGPQVRAWDRRCTSGASSSCCWCWAGCSAARA